MPRLENLADLFLVFLCQPKILPGELSIRIPPHNFAKIKPFDTLVHFVKLLPYKNFDLSFHGNMFASSLTVQSLVTIKWLEKNLLIIKIF